MKRRSSYDPVVAQLRADLHRIEVRAAQTVLPAYFKAQLPAASGNGGLMIYVHDATGGGVPAFSDNTSWRRVTDRTVVD